MTDDLVEISRRNIIASYSSLARAIPGARVRVRPSHLLVTGPSRRAYSNFAAAFRSPSTAEIEEILDLANHRSLWVFGMSGDTPPELNQGWIRGGLRHQNTLQMMAAPLPTESDCGEVWTASSEERGPISELMSEVFFSHLGASSQADLARTTREAGHAFLAIGPRAAPIAAAMICETSDCLGLYNVCCRPDMRRRGMGASLVRASLSMAARRAVPVVLQCDPGLSRWYSQFGFAAVGEVRAFGR